MKRVGITPEEHTYFQDENNLDIALVDPMLKRSYKASLPVVNCL